MDNIKKTIFYFAVLISVVGFFWASEDQFQDEIAIEEFYYGEAE